MKVCPTCKAEYQGGEVFCPDETVVGAHVGVDGGGDRAAIEGVRAFGGDQLERAREFGLDQATGATLDVERVGRFAIDQEGRGGGGELAQAVALLVGQ